MHPAEFAFRTPGPASRNMRVRVFLLLHRSHHFSLLASVFHKHSSSNQSWLLQYFFFFTLSQIDTVQFSLLFPPYVCVSGERDHLKKWLHFSLYRSLWHPNQYSQGKLYNTALLDSPLSLSCLFFTAQLATDTRSSFKLESICYNSPSPQLSLPLSLLYSSCSRIKCEYVNAGLISYPDIQNIIHILDIGVIRKWFWCLTPVNEYFFAILKKQWERSQLYVFVEEWRHFRNINRTKDVMKIFRPTERQTLDRHRDRQILDKQINR